MLEDGMREGEEDVEQLAESPNKVTDTGFPAQIPQQALRPQEVAEQAPGETTNGIRD